MPAAGQAELSEQSYDRWHKEYGDLQFGARGDPEGSETSRRLREPQFLAIVTPSVKHITTELARGA